jgi:hypothetical protein
MADAVNILREAIARLVAKEVGLRPEQPTVTASNQRSSRSHSQILAQPVDVTAWKPLQVTDTDSVNFGRFYFLPGYDVPGDPTKIIRS